MHSKALFAVLAALFLHLRVASAGSDDFRAWYPQYDSIFQNILDQNCTDEYATYLAGNFTPGQTPEGTSTASEAVVQCLLTSTSEFIKTNMGSAGVLLGIMPFALSVLGTSSEESALLFVIARRPLLTFLLLAASPVVVALRPFEYKDPVDILRSRERRFYSINLGPSVFILALEYIIALAALANVILVTYELGMGVVTMILPDAKYFPGLWAATGIIVHIIGALCLGSRLSVKAHKGDGTVVKENILRSEITLCAKKNIIVETLPERKKFLALSWLVSTSTTFHVIFGTLAFSSMQFISVRDAFGVIGRYTASVTVCRVVLMYELSGLRDAVESIEEKSSDDGTGLKDPKRVISRNFTLSM